MRLPMVAVLAGSLLLAASEAWTILFPVQHEWTAEKASRLIALSNHATDLKQKLVAADARPSMHAGENPAELLQRFREVDAEYNQLYRQHKAASQPPSPAPPLLRWIAIAFIFVGAIAVFVRRAARVSRPIA